MSPPGLRRKWSSSLWLVSLCYSDLWLVNIFSSPVWLTRPWPGPQDGQCRCQTLEESILSLAQLWEGPFEAWREFPFSQQFVVSGSHSAIRCVWLVVENELYISRYFWLCWLRININYYSAVSIPWQWVTVCKAAQSEHQQRLLKVSSAMSHQAALTRATHWPRPLTRS